MRVEVAHGCFDPLPAGLAFEGDAVSLRVSDAGPGIPAGIRDRMFDPFFTTKANGSGLGLAVVHRAIEAHRGLVFVDNGLRGGTRFTVILPTAQPLARSISMTGPAAKPTVLVVDDESGILDSLNILLRNEGFTPHVAHGGKAGLEKIDELNPDIVLTDIRMPNVSGVEILAAARQSDPDVPVILMTAQATLQSAMQAVNEGAFYYIQKPFRNDELVAILRRAAEHRNLRVENKSLKQVIRRHERQGVTRPDRHEQVWLDVLRLVETVAPTDSTVLIQGESGTGKEVIARYIHELSARTEGPFLSINCGALPESLLESELFGHVKGSFTGAVRDKLGLFGAASKGTFFLDEIGETTPATQVKLLRALQHREVIPVGSTEAIPVDTRVVAATNRDLDDEIRAGNFRSDLYYRLNVIALYLPPLAPAPRRHSAARRALSPAHRRHAQRAGRSASREPALEVLIEYAWPGNVRELENALERAIILTPGEEIGPEALPERVTERRSRTADLDAHAAQPDARGGRARVHHVGAAERERQQVARRRGAGNRSVDAVPQALAIRSRGVTRMVEIRRDLDRLLPVFVAALAVAVALWASSPYAVGVFHDDGSVRHPRQVDRHGAGISIPAPPGRTRGDALPSWLSAAVGAHLEDRAELSRQRPGVSCLPTPCCSASWPLVSIGLRTKCSTGRAVALLSPRSSPRCRLHC